MNVALRIHWAHISSTILNKTERTRRMRKREGEKISCKSLSRIIRHDWDSERLFFSPILQWKRIVWIHFTCGNICLLGFFYLIWFFSFLHTLFLFLSFSDFPRWSFFFQFTWFFSPQCSRLFIFQQHCICFLWRWYASHIHNEVTQIDWLLPAQNHFNKIEKVLRSCRHSVLWYWMEFTEKKKVFNTIPVR